MKIWVPFILIPILSICILQYANAEETEAVYQDWALRPAVESSSWVLEQRVYIEGGEEAPLVHMAIQPLEVVGGNAQGIDPLWVALRVPLGVLLRHGLVLQADEADPVGIPLHHCRSAGCIALLPLKPELRKILEAGNEARVTFQLLNGQRLGVPVSLMGIKAGLSALERKTATKP